MPHKTTETKHPSLAREKKRKWTSSGENTQKKKADTSMVITLVVKRNRKASLGYPSGSLNLALPNHENKSRTRKISIRGINSLPTRLRQKEENSGRRIRLLYNRFEIQSGRKKRCHCVRCVENSKAESHTILHTRRRTSQAGH